MAKPTFTLFLVLAAATATRTQPLDPEFEIVGLLKQAKFIEAQNAASILVREAPNARRWHLLGSAHFELGHFAEAEKAFRAGLDLQMAEGIDSPRLRVFLLAGLVLAENSQGKHAEAERTAEEAIRLADQRLPDDERTRGSAHLSAAEVFWVNGKLSRAEAELKLTIQLIETAAGPDHPDTGAVLSKAGAFYAYSRRPEMAIPLLRRAAAISRMSFGPDHADTIQAEYGLALAQIEAEPAEAERSLRRSLELWLRKNPEPQPRTALLYVAIAQALYFQRAYDEAVRWSSRSMDIYRVTFPTDNRHYAEALSTHARYLRAAGKRKEAGAAEKEVERILKATAGEDTSRHLVDVLTLRPQRKAKK